MTTAIYKKDELIEIQEIPTKESYTIKEAYEESLKYFNGDELAADVFSGKYALIDNQGNLKESNPDDMHRRLAREFLRIEEKYENPLSYDEIYELFKDFKYVIPQGSPMSAIGNDYQIQSASNCFVLPSVLDSYGSILKTDEYLIQISKRRGGNGLDISNIRPKGIATNNAAKTTDGIGVFMERYSNSIREVGQAGRRGALLISCSVHHPEILTFINIKKDKKKVTGANISVRFSDEFMNAVKNDEEYEQRWPIDSKNPSVIKRVNAKDIWNAFTDAAWESAEPGGLFWDTALKNTPSDIYKDQGFGSVSTNPCGEIILSPLDSCRLLAINLFSFVEDPFTKDARFNFKKYDDYVIKSQRLMDDLVTIETEQIDKILNKIKKDPEPEDVKRTEKELWLKIKDVCLKGRRTGLGITALGDTLAALGITYGDDDSIKMTERIYRHLAINSHKSSIILAKERGAFPVFDYELEKDHEYLNRIYKNFDEDTYKMYKKYGRRNIALTTTAPTGSVSTLTQTTSGIEPAYLLWYTRRRKINPGDKETRVDFIDDMGDKWQEYKIYHHKYKMWMEVTGKNDPEKSPYWKATSNDVDWLSSVKIQAVAQKWVDHSISKTCNLPNSASKELVADVYMKAWESGCKGFTVYRDGCRTGVLISETASNNTNKKNSFEDNHAPKRPKILPCDIHQATIKGESWTIFIGKLDGRPYEVFGGLSKYLDIPKKVKHGTLEKDGKKQNGSSMYDLFYGEDDDKTKVHDIVTSFENPTEGAFTRTLSLVLRHGTPIHHLVEQLQKDGKDSDMYSFSKVIARVLKHYIKEGTKASDKNCESCGTENSIMYKEGCKTCASCGFSRCG